MTQIETKQQEIDAIRERMAQDDLTRLSLVAQIKRSKEQTRIDEKILALHETQLALLKGLNNAQ